MQLTELQSVRDSERRTDKLQQLRESFYQDAGEYISQLRAERQRVADRADDPFDAPAVGRLSDEIETAESTVEAIYEKRVGKIVKAASLAAADMPFETEGMTHEERDLFERLVGEIGQNRERVFDVLEGLENPDNHDDRSESPSPSPASETAVTESAPDPDLPDEQSAGKKTAPSTGATAAETDPETEPTPAVADGVNAPETQTSPSTPAATEPDTDPNQPVRNDGGSATNIDRQTVRVTDDLDAFVGYDDREYDLGTDDVVSLPETNARPLVEHGVAEPFGQHDE